MTDILVAGETLIDLLPGAGETLHDIDGFAHRPGGAPANVAVGLSRLDTPPAFWTRLGGDPFGDFLQETLNDEGVPAAAFERVDGNTTLAVVSPPGVEGRRFRFYGSGDVTFGFESESVPRDALASTSWVHLGGVALTHPEGREAMRELAAVAAENGRTVSFDVNYREDLVPDGEQDAVVDAVREIVGVSDVVFASDEDVAATGLSSREGEALGHDLLDIGPHTAVVTLGEAGAVVTSASSAPWGERTARHAGFAVEAVDVTGAGDAFTAGLIARLSAGDTDLDGAVAFANATAALSVQERGGMTALPSKEAVESFLAERR
ncbi:carbohydrate kinase family protein [Halorubrum sp. HHNYT27]|uniref:carbohydrate kinase family protein n=1 Tax=Halorubrum sp. HHNYT27 TaxID=3402275 RepID=UPI003EB75016